MREKIIVELIELLFELGLLALTSDNLYQFLLQVSIAFFIRFGFWYMKRES